jgi:hypothetical protein
MKQTKNKSAANWLITLLAMASLFFNTASAFAQPTAVTGGAVSVIDQNPSPAAYASLANAHYRVQFTGTSPSAASSITVTFPARFTITSGAIGVGGSVGNAIVNGNGALPGFVTVGPAVSHVNSVIGTSAGVDGSGVPQGGTIIITFDAPTPLNTVVSFRLLQGVKNPDAQVTTAAITLTTTQDTEPASAGTIVVGPGLLLPASVTPASLAAGTLGNVNVSFTAPHNIPNNGKIVVVFPAGFNVTGANNGSANPPTVVAGNLSGINGTWTSTVSGQTVTLTQSGGSQTTAGAISFSIPGVRNPLYVVSPGAFSITTSDSANTAVDINPSVSGITTTPGLLTSAAVVPVSFLPGVTTSAQVYFTTVNSINSDGKIIIDFPSAFDLSGVVGATGQSTVADYGFDGTFTFATDTTSGNNKVIITRTTGGNSSAGTAARITIKGVRNSSTTGTLFGTFAITTTQAGGTIIDQNSTVPSVSLPGGALMSDSVVPFSSVAGIVGSVAVNFTTANVIPQGGSVLVIFPDGFDISQAAGQVGTALSGLDGTWTASLPGPAKILKLTQTFGGSTGTGVKSLTIAGIRNPRVSGLSGNVAGTSYPFAIMTQQPGGQAIDYDNNVAAVTITPGVLTLGQVAPDSSAAGAVGGVTIAFTSANPIPVDGQIIVTLPSTFDLSATPAYIASSAVGLDGGFSVGSVDATHKITITRTGGGNIAAAGAKSIRISNVKNPVVSGVTGTFSLQTALSDGTTLIDAGSAPSISIAPGVFSGSPTVTPADFSAGAFGNATISFTTFNTIPQYGKIQVIFPSGFDISGANGLTASSLSGFDGASIWIASVSGQTVTFTQSVGTSTSPGGKSMTIAGITNPRSPGSTGTYTITTLTPSNIVIDQSTAVAATTILFGALANATVQPSSIIIGQSGSAAISFTTVNPIPSGGKIVVTFPSGSSSFNVSGANGQTATSLSGFSDWGLVASVSGQVITFTQAGGIATSITPGSKYLVIGGIINPSTVSDPIANTATYVIRTTTSGNTVIDENAAVPATSFVQGALASATVAPSTLAAGGTSTALTINFTTAFTIPGRGKVVVKFGPNFDITGATLAGVNLNGNWELYDKTGKTIIFRETAGTASAAGVKTITVSGIVNPRFTGATGVYSIYTTDSAVTPNAIEGNQFVPSSTIIPGTLSPADVLTGTDSLEAGAINATTISFTSQNGNPIPAGGQIRVSFPANFDISAPGTVTTVDGFGGGTWTSSASGQTLTLTQASSGTASLGSPYFKIRVANILNPRFTGLTGTFSITTYTAGGVTIDQAQGVGVGKTILAGSLASANVLPAALLINNLGNVAVSFTAANPLPQGSSVKVLFPTGYVVSGAAGLTAASSLTGTWSVSVSGQTVTLTQVGGSITPAGTATTFTIGGIRTPTSVGPDTGYGLTTTLADGTTTIDTGSVPGNVFSQGAITASSVTPASLVAGATPNVLISFTTLNPIPVNGKIAVTFPTGFDVSSVASSPVGAVGGIDNTFNIAPSGQTVVITRSGSGSASGSGPKTITLSGIKNPTVTGSYGPFVIVTTDASNNPIDQDRFVAGVTISNGILVSTPTVVAVVPASLVTGAFGNATISFTTVNPIPQDGKIKVTFPAGFDISAANTLTASGLSGLDGTWTASVSGQIITFTQTSGGVAGIGGKSLTIGSIRNPRVSGTTGTYAIQTTTSGNTLIDTVSGVAGNAITAGALVGPPTVTPSQFVAGATGSATIDFQLGANNNPIPVNGQIQVIFPVGFNLAAANGATATINNSSLSGNWTATVGSTVISTVTYPVLTLVQSGGSQINPGSPSTKSLTISGIRNPQISGTTGTYTVTVADATGAAIDKATAAGSAITVGALTAASVTPASLVAGASGNVTATFTLANPIAKNGKISIIFPSEFSVGGVGGNAAFTGLNGSVWVSSVNSQTVTLTGDDTGGTTAAGTVVSVTFGPVRNPQIPGTASTYTISTANNSSTAIDTKAGVAGNTFTVGAITSATVLPASLNAGANPVLVTVAFTTANPIPADGKVIVTFPAGYNVAGTTVSSKTGLDGTLTQSVGTGANAQVVTLTRSSATVFSGGAVSIVLANIVNPSAVGLTGTASIQTTTSTGTVIDQNGAVPGNIITTGTFTSPSVGLSSYVVGANSTVTIRFTTATEIPVTGKIKLTFGAGASGSSFNLSSASFTSISAGGGSTALSVSGQTVTLTRSGGSIINVGTTVTIVLGNITNPLVSGLTGTYYLTTTTAGDAPIDAANPFVAGSTITQGALTVASVTPASFAAGATGGNTISFTTASPIPQGGKILVTFPSGYDLAGVSATGGRAATGPYNLTGTWTAPESVSGLTLTLTQSGGLLTPAGTQIFLTIAGIKNPPVTGQTGAFAVETQTGSSSTIDVGSASPITITPGVLTGTDLAPVAAGSAIVNGTGNATVSFTTANPIPADGKIIVTFPAGYSVAGTTVSSKTGLDGTLTPSVNAQVVTLTRSGGGTSSSGAVSIVLAGVINPGTAQITGPGSIATFTSADVAIDAGAFDGKPIAAAVLSSASVVPASLAAGASGNVVIAFTTVATIPNPGKIKVTFPSAYNISGANGLAATSLSGLDGTWTASVSGQIITFTQTGGSSTAPGAKSLTIGNIANPNMPGATGTYAILTTGFTDVPINILSNIAGNTIDSATMAVAQVTPAATTAGSVNNVTVNFTTINPIPDGGRIRITFGSGFTWPSTYGSSNALSLVGLNATWRASIAGQAITLSQQTSGNDGAGHTASAAGQKSLTLGGIVNPMVSGPSGTYLIETLASTGNTPIDMATVSSTIITPHSLITPTAVVPVSLVAGPSGNGNVSITFTNFNPIPVGASKIIVTFPAGFNVSGANTPVGSVGLSGTWYVSVLGQTLTFTGDSLNSLIPGASAVANDKKVLTVGGIVNPPLSGTTGTYAVSTADSSGNLIDTDVNVAGSVITPAVIASGTVIPVNLNAGNTGPVNVSFITASPMPFGSKILITFGNGFNVSGASGSAAIILASGGVNINGIWSASVSGQTVILSQTSGSSTPAGAQVALQIVGIKNPPITGSTGNYGLETRNSSDVIIDQNLAINPSVVAPGAMAAASVVPANLGAGRTGNVTISFTAANPIQNLGKIIVVFPGGYDVSGANGLTATPLGGLDGTWTAVVQSQTLILSQTGGSTANAGPVSLSIGGIQNPQLSGATGTYTVQTTSSGNVIIDQATAGATTITSGQLVSTAVTPASPVAGTVNSVTITFTTVNQIPVGGKIIVTFPTYTSGPLNGFGFNVNAVNNASYNAIALSGLDGTWTPTVAGQVVTLTRVGGSGSPIAAGSKSLTIPVVSGSGIINPTRTGTYGPFQIVTANASGTAIDADANVASIQISSGQLIAASVTPPLASGNAVAGLSGSAVLQFTTINLIPSGGKIKVTFPSGFSLTGANGFNASGLSGMDGAWAATVSGQQLILTQSGGSSSSAGVKSLSINGVRNPQVSGTTGTYIISTTDSSDNLIDSALSIAGSTITSGQLTLASVTPASTIAGVSGNVTVALTSPNPIPQGGKIKVAFPAGFDVTAAAGQSVSGGSLAGLTGTWSATVSGQVVTFTQSGGADNVAGAKALTVGGIKNPQVTGLTAGYTLTTTTSADVTIDTGAAAATTISAGLLTETSVQPQSMVANVETSVVVSFTTANTIPNLGKIKVTFGAGFNLTDAGARVATALVGLDGVWTSTVSGQTVILTQTGGGATAPGVKSITLGNVITPVTSGNTGTYSILTTMASDVAIDSDVAVPGSLIASAALVAASVQPANMAAGTTNAVTIGFTTATTIPAGGKVKVTFPTGFDISRAATLTATALLGLDGTWTATVSGQVLTLTQSGGTAAIAGAKSLTIASIRNPQVSGVTGTYAVTTTTASDLPVDVASVAGSEIIPAALTVASVAPASLVAGTPNNVTISFTTANIIPNLGKVKVIFPTGFNVSGADSLAAGALSGLDGAWTATVVGQTITITQTGGAATAAGSKSLTIANVINPQVSGSTGAFVITTTTAGDLAIDTDPAVAAQTITVNAITSASVIPISPIAGAITPVTVAFTSANPIPFLGQIKIAFPAGFGIDNATGMAGTLNGLNGTWTSSVVGQVLTLTQTGGTGAAAGLHSFTLLGIINPTVAAVTGTFVIQTANAAGTPIDQDNVVPAVTLIAGSAAAFSVAGMPNPATAGLASSITVTARDQYANVASSYTGSIAFTSSDASATLPSTGLTFTVADAGIKTFTGVILKSAGSRTITATDTQDSNITGSQSVIVGSSVAASLRVTAASSIVTAGQSDELTVTAYDVYGNVATSYSGLKFLSFDGLQSIGAFHDQIEGNFQVTATIFNNGVSSGGSLTFQGFVARQAVIHVTDGVINSEANPAYNANVTINSGSASALAVIQQPTSHLTGVVITPAVAFQVIDTYGNSVAPTTEVTVVLSKSFGNGILAGTLSKTTVHGLATFSDLSVDTAGYVKLFAQSAPLQPIETAFFQITERVVDHFTISTIGTQTAGTPFNVAITALDSLSSVVTNFTGTVSFAATPAGPITPAVSGAFVNGQLTAAVTLNVAGPAKTITVTSTSGTATGTSGAFDLVPGVFSGFTFAAIGNQVAGTPFGVTITAVDSVGNTISNFVSTVSLTTAAGAITPTTSAAAVNGVVTQQVTVTAAGSQTITAAASGKTSTSSAFGVAPAALDHFSIGSIAAQVAGTPFAIAITAQDVNNNTVTNFTGNVNLSTTAGAITPAQSGSFVNGQRTESVSVSVAGTGKTITVTQLGGTKSGVSGSFNVTTGVLARFGFDAIASQKVGVAFNVVITALDTAGNTVSNFTGTVNLSAASGTITPTTSSAFVNGKVTQQVTLNTAGTQAIAATKTGGSEFGGSGSFNVAAVVASRYVVTASTNSPASGSTITVTAQLADDSGVPVKTANRQVEWTSTQGGSLSASTSKTDANGLATISFTVSSQPGTLHTVSARTVVLGVATYTGTSGNILTDGALDTDGDGFTNLQELIAGTEALNPNSYLHITALYTSGTDALLDIAVVPNQVYTIEGRDSLTNAWETLLVFTNSATDTTVTFQDPNVATNGASMYYHVVTGPNREVISDLVGFSSLTLTAGANAISAPIHKIATALGSIASVSGNTVTLAYNYNWTANVFAPVGGYAQYILIVRKDGSASPGIQGDWWTIASNTGNTVTLNPGADNIGSYLAAGDAVEIRKLTSIQDLFGYGGNVILNKDSTGAYGPSGDYSGTDIIRLISGTSFGNPIWYFSGRQGIAEGYFIGATTGPLDGSTITVLPGQAIMVYRKTGSSSLNILVNGQVQVTPLTQYLKPGPNAIGSLFDVSAPIATSNLKESGWNLDTTGAASRNDYSNSDLFRLVTGTSFGNPVWYYNGSNGAPVGWYFGSATNNYILQPGKAYMFFVKPAANVIRWRQAVPYTP